jgi:hypothetical protein
MQATRWGGATWQKASIGTRAELAGDTHPWRKGEVSPSANDLPVTMESAAAMQPTRPGVAYTAQSAVVCATISPSVFGASGGLVPNDRSSIGDGSQLDVPAAPAAAGVSACRRRQAERARGDRDGHHRTVADAARTLLVNLLLRLPGPVAEPREATLQEPVDGVGRAATRPRPAAHRPHGGTPVSRRAEEQRGKGRCPARSRTRYTRAPAPPPPPLTRDPASRRKAVGWPPCLFVSGTPPSR